MAKGGSGTAYKAIWIDGFIKVFQNLNQWSRWGGTEVVLKGLHDSQDITAEFFEEVSYSFLITINTSISAKLTIKYHYFLSG